MTELEKAIEAARKSIKDYQRGCRCGHKVVRIGALAVLRREKCDICRSKPDLQNGEGI